MEISIIVLAAGLSTRFGRNKLLEPVGSSTLIEHVVSETMKSKAQQVIVVGGHDFEKVGQLLGKYGCAIVYNNEFAKGQSFSVRKGISAVDGNADAVMILPGDILLMNHHIIDSVIDAFVKTHAPIISAGYRGSPGHPILFSRELFQELKEIDEATRGLKKVVSNHMKEAKIVETSPAALFDLDTQQDFERLKTIRSELQQHTTD
ncbi:MAG: nucleotidyltransferase family protein [Nitrososphaerota archaeon]|nr:nucleotidyltransferase family protein [Nitrososphaerota archaeon]